MKFTSFFTLMIVSSIAFAKVDSFKITNKLTSPAADVALGSEIQITSDEKELNGKFLFLGNTVNPAGEETYRMLLNTKTKVVSLVNSDEFKKNKSLQKVLDPYEQKGGTCTGYAIFDFLQQSVLSNFEGNGELPKLLSNEEGRSQLLADSINKYYLETQHRNSINGIMNSYGKQFGFKCTNFKTDSVEKAKEKVLAILATGKPIIFSFNIGPKMATAPFSISKFNEKNGELDNRLWIPRKTGERNSGGHSIVAAGSFKLEDKNYLVMIDSDWTEPRIWDLDSYLSSKTAIEEMEFISCK